MVNSAIMINFDEATNSTSDQDNNLNSTTIWKHHFSHYVDILITLDVICVMLIVLLTLVSIRALKFLVSKDRILLSHFILLELSLTSNILNFNNHLAKITTLIYATIYY